MKVYFITFANKKSSFDTKRIVDEATSSGYFDVVMDFSEEKLDTIFWQKHEKFIKQNPKGFGFWIWKPQIIWQALQTMHDGDILCYADAGSTIHYTPKAKKRMQHYIKLVKDSPYGILSFELPHQEKRLCKQALLEFLQADNNIQNSAQLIATHIIIKKCHHVMTLVKKWLDVATNHYNFLDDTKPPSGIPTPTPMKYLSCLHRHDQAIFSILRKQYGTEILPDESWQDPYDFNFDSPLLATRLKKNMRLVNGKRLDKYR
ncbi:MAG: hypothetical protein ACR2NY_01615 [Alphaproteobacteria bacterium]